uniref:Uncharacterized protein n=1 Tax=Solanum lycopersicum TaxID=4081 RepID=A0A3Q7ETT6_SOLLC
MAFKFNVASTSDCPPDKNCSQPNNIESISIRDSWGNPPLEETESIVCDLLRSGPVFAFSTRSNHAWFQEDTLKHDIVLSQVEEDFSPDLLCYLKSPVNAVFTVQQDLWLHNWDQTIVLRNGSVASQAPCCFLDSQCRWSVGNAHHAPEMYCPRPGADTSKVRYAWRLASVFSKPMEAKRFPQVAFDSSMAKIPRPGDATVFYK